MVRDHWFTTLLLRKGPDAYHAAQVTHAHSDTHTEEDKKINVFVKESRKR